MTNPEDSNRDLQAKLEVFLGDKAVRESEEQVRKEEFEAFRSRYEMMKKPAGLWFSERQTTGVQSLKLSFMTGKFERASLEKDSKLIELKYELGQAKLKCDELQMKSDMLEEQLVNLNSGTKEIVEHNKLTDKLKKQVRCCSSHRCRSARFHPPRSDCSSGDGCQQRAE